MRLGALAAGSLLLAFLAWAPVGAWAAERLVQREIIAFHDPNRKEGESWNQPAHVLAEAMLNHLGFTVRYLDIHRPLPAWESLPGVGGVLLWLDDRDRFHDPFAFLDWAEEGFDTGRKFAILGALPFIEDSKGKLLPLKRLNRFWKRMGLKQVGDWINLTYLARPVVKVSDMVEFERPISGVLPAYELMTAIDPGVRTYLSLSHPQNPKNPDKESQIVIVGPGGGYVAANYAYFLDAEADYQKWYLNPLRFFREVFDRENIPKPEASTVSGRRIYYSHIDGDGWRNICEIKDYKKKLTLSSEVIHLEVLTRYPDLPVTVAPIAGDLDPAWYGDEETQEIARRIFALPHVEMASHTYSHPLEWGFFEEGDPDKEAPFMDLYPPRGRKTLSQVFKKFLTKEKKERTADAPGRTVRYLKEKKERKKKKRPSPVKEEAPRAAEGEPGEAIELSNHYETPRAYAVAPSTARLEVTDSINYINRFAPPGKRVALVQWSGDTLPYEAALKETRLLGLYNINGGNSRFDREFPSLAWVAPMGRVVGGERQIYATNANENTYTDLWTDRFFGFKHLVRTINNTESPVRLKPFNVYYHMYSGEKLSSLKALVSNLDYARTQELAPIDASRFAAIGDGFFTTRMVDLGGERYRIENRGALSTVRFDRATTRAVDWSRSVGLVGARSYQGSLYVTLDEAHPAPVVALTERARLDRETKAIRPYLIHGRWRVWQLEEAQGGFRFLAQGYGAGSMTWMVPEPGAYEVTASLADSSRKTWRFTADADGRLEINLKADANRPIALRVAPVEEAAP